LENRLEPTADLAPSVPTARPARVPAAKRGQTRRRTAKPAPSLMAGKGGGQ